MKTHQEDVEHSSEELYIEEEPIDVESSFAAPFPVSGEIPRVDARQAGAKPEPPQRTANKRPLSLRMISLIICLIVIGGITLMNVLAQTIPPLIPTQRTMATVPVPTPVASPQGSSFDWVPMQLPDGWTNAGFLSADALQALRTGVAFTDREMSLDYRSVGTRANHGGTLVAATFLLTPAAVTRFAQNDVRVVNNTLFDMMAQTKLVRVVVNPQPQLVKFAQSGPQQFAWVDVAFQLWQSKMVGGQRIDGTVIDATTNQPQVHHLMVLLLHVPAQGNNPAMGGTGWLVSTYALDPASVPDIVQPA